MAEPAAPPRTSSRIPLSQPSVIYGRNGPQLWDYWVLVEGTHWRRPVERGRQFKSDRRLDMAFLRRLWKRDSRPQVFGGWGM